jgi:hypothetical protein
VCFIWDAQSCDPTGEAKDMVIPDNTTASPQLGSCCVAGDVLAANSTFTTGRPKKLAYAFSSTAVSDGDPEC